MVSPDPDISHNPPRALLSDRHIRTSPLDGVEPEWRRRRTTHGVVAADSVDEVVARCYSGAGATATQRRARAPAVRVWAVAFDRAETGRTVATTHDEQPNSKHSHAITAPALRQQSCPWLGLTRGLAWAW